MDKNVVIAVYNNLTRALESLDNAKMLCNEQNDISNDISNIQNQIILINASLMNDLVYDEIIEKIKRSRG